MEKAHHTQVLKQLVNTLSSVLLGKPDAVKESVACLICRGHLLVEDVPGVGKTLLAKALSISLDATCTRLQFTPDLLPSEVTGSMIYNQQTGEFYFRKGPVFTDVLLGDEINRATPRTQSSLLECMEERQVSVDGKTYPMADHFFVIATQNPIELQGTYPLPEAQLDRFFMKIHIGYLQADEEVAILQKQATTQHWQTSSRS